ncbi:unnamed protein product [Cuscuta campestris]|uniref:Uncharacterized protein n=1 Tax=Cuscuta campestris TaxID=132261 RepID=A0A484MWS4_9ASTE|nr:unnamed protein product [Cuscuta campestris]
MSSLIPIELYIFKTTMMRSIKKLIGTPRDSALPVPVQNTTLQDQEFKKEIFIDPVGVPDDDLILDPIAVVPVTVVDVVVDVSGDDQRDQTVQAKYSSAGVIFYGCMETFGTSESDVVVLYNSEDVAQLEDNNYPSWSSTVKATLQAHKLLGFVEGTEVMPSPTILDEKAPASDKGLVLKANPAYDLWIIIDAQLRASLLALLSPAVKNLVKGQSSMQKYLDEALQIVNSLALAREPVSEQDVILNVLRGLPPEYASLKQNVRTNIATVTLNSISSWLISEELNIQLEQKLQLRSSSSSSTDLPTALFNEEFSGSSSAGTNPQAFYTAYSTDPGPNWHLDSGESTHVTYDLSRLQNP